MADKNGINAQNEKKSNEQIQVIVNRLNSPRKVYKPRHPDRKTKVAIYDLTTFVV